MRDAEFYRLLDTVRALEKRMAELEARLQTFALDELTRLGQEAGGYDTHLWCKYCDGWHKPRPGHLRANRKPDDGIPEHSPGEPTLGEKK